MNADEGGHILTPNSIINSVIGIGEFCPVSPLRVGQPKQRWKIFAGHTRYQVKEAAMAESRTHRADAPHDHDSTELLEVGEFGDELNGDGSAYAST